MKIYFIVNELLNNIIKHSGADESSLDIEEKEGVMTIKVSDNGIGFDANKPNAGEAFGLTRIRARINKMNGVLTISSKPNAGTSVVIKLPIEK